MSSQINKKNDILETVVIGLFKGMAGFSKCAFYGMKRLNNVVALLGLFIFIFAAAGAYIHRDLIFEYDAPVYIKWLILCVLLALPLIYLAMLGLRQYKSVKEYYTKFSEINFVGKDKKFPLLLFKKEDGKQEILAFKSNIPISIWEKSQPQLETAFDASILKMEPLGSKKKVKLTTVGSSYKLPVSILWDDGYMSSQDGVLVIGENALEQVTFDLNRTPHVLAAGETGSGKSVILRMMFWQLVNQGCVPFMLDFKGGIEFGIMYERFGEVITEREEALELLELLVEENRLRMKKFRSMEVKNLKEYNERSNEKLSRIGVYCDEIGEMLDKQGLSGDEKEQVQKLSGYLSTLARLSRATGINLILGVQRPDANVITGQIKNNVPVRICGRFADKSASEIVLGNTDACRLPDIKGRFLFKAGADTTEFQAYYFDDETMLGAVDTTEHQVMLPALAKRLVSAPTAAAASVNRHPEITQAEGERKPREKAKNDVTLNFNYGKRRANEG